MKQTNIVPSWGADVGGSSIANAPSRFVIFGSSTMAYGNNGDVGAGSNESYGSPWIHLIAVLGRGINCIKNYAVAGATTPTIAAAISNMPANTADWAVVHFGGNDLTVGNLTSTQVLAYFDAAATDLRSKGIKYIVAVIPHAKLTADGNTLAIYNEIKAYRAGLQSRAAVDTYMRIVDHAEAIRDTASATGDSLASMMSGIHMNGLGHVTASGAWIRALGKDFPLAWDSRPASLGAVVSDCIAEAAPTLSGATCFSLDNGDLRMVSTAGNAFRYISISKATISSTKTYRMVISFRSIVAPQALGLYMRDNASANIWSVGRYVQGSATVIEGSRLSIVGRSFSIPQSVIDGAANFVFGIALQGVGATVEIESAALVAIN